jgi:glycerol-3-phosphate dehydrogenase (NAD(P)+)
MKIGVIGAGRWGSFIASYLAGIGFDVTLFGRKSSAGFSRFSKENLPNGLSLSSDIANAALYDRVVVAINSQSLRGLLETDLAGMKPTSSLILCMKGIEILTGMRLSEVTHECLPEVPCAVWLGPGHPEQFAAGIPNCMVIDSDNDKLKKQLVDDFSGSLIRFYYGTDLIGNEIGAACKNVIGIAAGLLDGYNMSSLKGALMARGTREVSRLIEKLGGKAMSAYGLCCLGDFEATLFSKYSHNRAFGEAYAKGEKFTNLAEGYYTIEAVHRVADKNKVDMPITGALYGILYEKKPAKEAFGELFARDIKSEF